MKSAVKPLPEGPKGSFFSGCADKLKNQPLEFLTDCHNQYGNIVPFNVGPFPVLLLNEPELMHTVLVTQAHNFTKDAAIKNNRAFFGEGLLSSEGDLWKQERRLASPSFNHKSLELYGQIMIEHTQKMLDRFVDGQTIEIQKEMMRLTLGIAAKTLFDSEISKNNTEFVSALIDAQKYLACRMNNPLLLLLPEWIPFPTNIHLLEAIKKVDTVIFKLIDERRNHTEGKHDLLSTFIALKENQENSGLSDKLIRDEVFTLFFAGHETTALTLTWTLYLLASYPEVAAKLVQELNTVLKGRLPEVADYSALTYTEKVIKESMRLRPPVWAIGRENIHDCLIGEYEIKKGTAVILSQWVMHHDKRFYDSPDSFNPERWTPEFTHNLPKFAYFPFGGGPRTCIGNGFAMLESVMALSSIMQKFSLELEPDQNVKLLPAVTLRPENDIRLKLHKR